MYNYSYDPISGGILLNTLPVQYSKEPRPVYSAELDILGFDKHWDYDKQNNIPYMWAEANKYFYYGRLVAQTKGGTLYNAPEIEVLEELRSPLQPIDIEQMLKANESYLQILEQETKKRIYDVWKRYRDRLDIFYVAFSGGKDSVVLLDLVKGAIPKDEFAVIFGDTQMEFPDTYDVIEKTEFQCRAEGIAFHKAKSHMNIYESWKQFAPPSRVLRWCCSVHKSAPQIIKLREVLEKNNFTGMAFVGIRAAESFRRNGYDYESDGMKQKGQFSANPILDWISCEVWIYIYANKLIINETYKKGNIRAGCLLCPMSPGKADYLRYANYRDKMDNYINIIMDTTSRSLSKKECMNKGVWIARNNGVSIQTNIQYRERLNGDSLFIEVNDPKTDWKEWIKTIGYLQKEECNYVITAKECRLDFKVTENSTGYVVQLPLHYTKKYPALGKYFRQVFRKSAYCLACKTCEANCKNKCISFDGGFKIEDCNQCRECHSIPSGCLAYHSLNLPQGDGKMKKSINTLGTHAPKTEWLAEFFKNKEGFLQENTLGPVQKYFFLRFLRDAELIAQGKTLPLTDKLAALGWDTPFSLGIMLANVAYNPQFKWYIKNIEVGTSYPRKHLEDIMLGENITVRNAKSVLGDFKRFVKTPFGKTLNFGFVDKENNYHRSKCVIGSPLVILYSLYKFAEACGDFFQFTVSRLLNFVIDSNGVSPAQIFGIEAEELKTTLAGLAAKFPGYITIKFTHDLDDISLNVNKNSYEIISELI